LEVAAADHRDADVTRDLEPIRHHEVLIALEHVDPDRAQQALGEPRHLGAGVHEDLTDARPPGLFARPADLDVHAERAHGPADSGTRVAGCARTASSAIVELAQYWRPMRPLRTPTWSRIRKGGRLPLVAGSRRRASRRSENSATSASATFR